MDVKMARLVGPSAPPENRGESRSFHNNLLTFSSHSPHDHGANELRLTLIPLVDA